MNCLYDLIKLMKYAEVLFIKKNRLTINNLIIINGTVSNSKIHFYISIARHSEPELSKSWI
jgi:hypothetical protein